MSFTKNLLSAAREYCEKTGRARSGVAKEILNDAKFFDRIEGGAGCTMLTYEKVTRWFQDNPPATKVKKTRTQ